MCRYTGQVIAVKKDNATDHINFKMLLSQLYFNNTQQKVSYLTNWVSNARVPGAVEENRRIEDINGSFWYYSNPLLETSCRRQFIYYRPDMVAYLGDSYEECACVRNVCVQTVTGVLPVQSGEFSRNGSYYPCNNESVRSYWIPLYYAVYLYSFSSKFNVYYMIPTTYNKTNFPEVVQDSATINEMENLSSCFEAWLDGLKDDPGQLNSSRIAAVCNSSKIKLNWNGYNISNAIVASHVGTVWSSLKQSLATGDNCQENSTEETVCSSDILTSEEKQRIANLLTSFRQIKEVKASAKSQWEEMGTKRHDAYVDIVTAILAFFAATMAVSSNTLVEIEQFVVKCYCCLSKQGKTDSRCVDNVEQIVIKLPYHELRPHAPEAKKLRFSFVFLRWIIRFFVLVAVIGKFAYTTLDTLKKLKSGPDVGWTQTIEYQPYTTMAFLVTTTSTTEVAPKWTNMYILGAIILPSFILIIHRIYKHVLYWPASPKPYY